MWMRSVGMESGTCLSLRIGGAAGSETVGKGRFLDPWFCAMSAGGKKKPLAHQKAVGRDTERGMVMEAAPAAALEMAEPDLLLQLPIVALDAPAQLDQLDHALQRHVLGQGRQPEVSRPRLVLGPLDDQPFLLIGVEY